MSDVNADEGEKTRKELAEEFGEKRINFVK